jgi:uracil DNA glycosylase
VIIKKFGETTLEISEHPFSLQGWIDQGVYLMNNTPVLYVSKTANEKTKAKAKEIWSGMSSLICKFIDSKNK